MVKHGTQQVGLLEAGPSCGLFELSTGPSDATTDLYTTVNSPTCGLFQLSERALTSNLITKGKEITTLG